MSDWNWNINLDPLVGKHAHLETKDGIRREGRISAIVMKSFKLDGQTVDVPGAFELNGDPVDLIPVERLLYVNFVRLKNDQKDSTQTD